MPEEPEQEETYAAADETSGYERITDIRASMRRKMKKTYSHLMKGISVKVNLILTQDMNMNQTA